MNALRKTVEQKVSASASKQVAKPGAAKISTRGDVARRTQAGFDCQMGERVRLANGAS